MKQVFRRVLDRKGVVSVEEVPAPLCGGEQVKIATEYTVISAGTESATLSKTFPELVKQTVQDPWMRQAVKNLVFGSSPITTANIVWDETTLMRAIGYSGCGTVLEVGDNVQGFKVGQRVAFAAEGHAEIVTPSQNFVVPVPEGLDMKHAAFVTLGGIAMQGVRRAEVQIGEKVAVIGQGLVGSLVSQLAHAAGGQVIGVDVNATRLGELAQAIPSAQTIDASLGDPVETVRSACGGQGADVTIICAQSTDSEIANQAMKMTRKRGKVVFVGIVKMDLERMPFFQNELDLRFSRAYGPGCMEADYEAGRVDYPHAYVRWTQQRNLASFLEMVAQGRVNIDPLIGGIEPIAQAQAAYDSMAAGGAVSAMLLQYSDSMSADNSSLELRPRRTNSSTSLRMGVIGCGNFTRGTHLPNLNSSKQWQIAAIASATGTNAVSAAERFKVEYTSTDWQALIADESIDAVLVATRHNLHAEIAVAALRAGKHVFVEKPAALNEEQLLQLESALSEGDGQFLVGYNRRYSKLCETLRGELSDQAPLIIHYQVCVPTIPSDHWTLDPVEGGGRLIGEAEHFFDTCNYLVGSAPTACSARCLLGGDETIDSQYNFSVDLQYGQNALATVIYTGFAAPGTPRERITVHQSGKSWELVDFKTLRREGPSKKRWRLPFADMGHRQELEYFTDLVQGNKTNTEDPLAASRIALMARASLREFPA
jgi:predicted dehydrogenase/threonine dehydrogenase-like Zn-dependent dehydrogenase